MNHQLEQLKANIESEMIMVRELSGFLDRSEHAGFNEKNLFNNMISSLIKRIKLINNSAPELIGGLSFTKKLPSGFDKESDVEGVAVGDYKNHVLIKKGDKETFLKELNISEALIKKLKKKKLIKDEERVEYKKPSSYGKLSNKFFLETVDGWIKRGNFKSFSLDLRRSNLNILTTTYLSMMLFSILISVFVGIFLFGFFMFFSLGFDLPFVSFYDGSYFSRLLKVSWIIIAVPILTGLAFYFFPSAERKSLSKRISQELPFVVIHMASVSGSGIEPSEIFKIIGLSKEYKYAGKEIRKVLNQINIYGYDLTNALRNVALSTPSPKLSELLNGIGVTINSGGDMKIFFEKRAESLLLDYRLEREKFTKTAETFMDIYISIVIAAPMILLMLLVMMAVSGIQTGLGINQMTFAIVGIVAIINIIFLTFLHLKQPGY